MASAKRVSGRTSAVSSDRLSTRARPIGHRLIRRWQRVSTGVLPQLTVSAERAGRTAAPGPVRFGEFVAVA
jgi:hypothetical protein